MWRGEVFSTQETYKAFFIGVMKPTPEFPQEIPKKKASYFLGVGFIPEYTLQFLM